MAISYNFCIGIRALTGLQASGNAKSSISSRLPSPRKELSLLCRDPGRCLQIEVINLYKFHRVAHINLYKPRTSIPALPQCDGPNPQLYCNHTDVRRCQARGCAVLANRGEVSDSIGSFSTVHKVVEHVLMPIDSSCSGSSPAFPFVGSFACLSCDLLGLRFQPHRPFYALMLCWASGSHVSGS